MTVIAGVQLASAIAAFISAAFWWLSASRNFAIAAKLDDRTGEDGDIAFDLGDGRYHVQQNGKSSRLNAWAAFFAAIAASLQAWAILASIS
jgi:hypothetical protein